MEPDDSGYLDPIGGETPDPNKPAQPDQGNDMKPPVVIGVPYPPDPTPNQPGQDETTQPQSPNVPSPVTPPVVGDGYHLVVKGDTLYSISRKYNTTVERIKQLNNLPDNVVRIGQRLRVK